MIFTTRRIATPARPTPQSLVRPALPGAVSRPGSHAQPPDFNLLAFASPRKLVAPARRFAARVPHASTNRPRRDLAHQRGNESPRAANSARGEQAAIFLRWT